jgi:regulator of protease activity HflC (stomatin/prohibitin superfamily)
MKRFKFMFTVGLLALSSMLTGCMGFIDTGTVGVRTSFGETNPVEEGQGFYTNFVSSLDIYTVKQVALELNDMRPKAADNLSLKELDATVYYTVDPSKVAELAIKYKGQSYREGMGDDWLPAYNLVQRQARSVIEKEVANITSLVVHSKREDIEKASVSRLQEALDKEDPGVFKVERITIVKAVTDDSIEESIRKVVQAQKENEAMTYKIETAEKQAQLNQKLNSTYTSSYLQHEYNVALTECAKRVGCTMIVGNPSGQILNLK